MCVCVGCSVFGRVFHWPAVPLRPARLIRTACVFVRAESFTRVCHRLLPVPASLPPPPTLHPPSRVECIRFNGPEDDGGFLDVFAAGGESAVAGINSLCLLLFGLEDQLDVTPGGQGVGPGQSRLGLLSPGSHWGLFVYNPSSGLSRVTAGRITCRKKAPQTRHGDRVCLFRVKHPCPA